MIRKIKAGCFQVFLDLESKHLGRGKEDFISQLFQEEEVDFTSVEVAVEINYIAFNTAAFVSGNGWAVADVGDGGQLLLPKMYTSDMYARGNDFIGRPDIGGGESQIAPLRNPMYNLARNTVRPSQHPVGHFNPSRRQVIANTAAADADTVPFNGGTGKNAESFLWRRFLKKRDASFAVSSEKKVFADNDFFGLKPVQQNILQKVHGGHGRQIFLKWNDQGGIDLVEAYLFQALIKGLDECDGSFSDHASGVGIKRQHDGLVRSSQRLCMEKS